MLLCLCVFGLVCVFTGAFGVWCSVELSGSLKCGCPSTPLPSSSNLGNPVWNLWNLGICLESLESLESGIFGIFSNRIILRIRQFQKIHENTT